MIQMMVMVVQAQESEKADCDSSLTCRECLTTENCGFWQNLPPEADANGFLTVNGFCSNDCPVPDAICYASPTLQPSPAESSCVSAEKAAANDALCASRSNTTCSDCVSAIGNFDGYSTKPCQWYQFAENGPSYCASGCDPRNGLCGASKCSKNNDTTIIDPSNIPTLSPTFNVTPYCDLIESCTECLETEGCGYWHATRGCDSFCNDPAPCYNRNDFSNQTSDDELCQMAQQEAADDKRCAEQSSNSDGSVSCEACVAAFLSDGVNSCGWFPDSKSCGRVCTVAEGCPTIDCWPGFATSEEPTPRSRLTSSAGAPSLTSSVGAPSRVLSIWASGVIATWIAATLV
jgi:hypothetical protein